MYCGTTWRSKEVFFVFLFLTLFIECIKHDLVFSEISTAEKFLEIVISTAEKCCRKSCEQDLVLQFDVEMYINIYIQDFNSKRENL